MPGPQSDFLFIWNLDILLLILQFCFFKIGKGQTANVFSEEMGGIK